MQLTTSTYDRRGLFIVVAIAIFVIVIQAENLFKFPYYQDSEGTSISNALALVQEGNLSPYTYAYEDPPFATFIIGAWTLLTGGIDSFGFSVNSGRVLMLVFHMLTVALIYGIAKKTTKSDLVAIIASFVFAFSPLASTLQRRVIVDNIAIVWLLLALYLVLGDERRLKHYFLSAVAFALAVLTKGSAIWFLPAFIYIIALKANKLHRRFASGHWLALSAFVISLYPLYAQMKQELFPQGWFLGGDFPHVSLLERLMDRGPDTGRFLNFASGLSDSLHQWVDITSVTGDPILIYGGLISVVFVLLLAIDNKNVRPVLAVLIAYAIKLLFGGPVFVSDAVALLPFLAISVGIVAGTAARAITTVTTSSVMRFAFAGITAAVFLYPFGAFYGSRIARYTVDQVEGQVQAIDWLNANVPEDAVIVTDNYAFVDLRTRFSNAHHYWKVDTDPAVKYNILADDVCNIDYLVTTPQVIADINLYGMDLMRRTLERSEILMSYPNNGWPIEIRQVSKRDCVVQLFGETSGEEDSASS